MGNLSDTDIQRAPSAAFWVWTPQVSKFLTITANLLLPTIACLTEQSSEILGSTLEASLKTGTVPNPAGKVTTAVKYSSSSVLSHLISVDNDGVNPCLNHINCWSNKIAYFRRKHRYFLWMPSVLQSCRWLSCRLRSASRWTQCWNHFVWVWRPKRFRMTLRLESIALQTFSRTKWLQKLCDKLWSQSLDKCINFIVDEANKEVIRSGSQSW